MPQKFNSCIKKGGAVRTVSHGKGKGHSYVHICRPPGSTHWTAGHVKHAKSSGSTMVQKK